METDVPCGENPKREMKLRGTVSENSCSQPLSQPSSRLTPWRVLWFDFIRKQILPARLMCQTPVCWMRCVSSWTKMLPADLPSASLASLSITDHADRARHTSFQACLHAQAGKWSLPVLLGPLTVDRREKHALWWAESAVAIWLCPAEGCYGKKGERGRNEKKKRKRNMQVINLLMSLIIVIMSNLYQNANYIP